MKKYISVMVAIILSFTLSIIVYASYMDTIQATKVQYPIIVNETQVDKDIPMVSIEDRIYLPIRAMCEVLGIGIEWNDEGRVEIMTDKASAETNQVEIGYYGVEGWTSHKTLDFELSKETAIAIADDIFLQMKGKEFLMETVVGINETDDGTCYSIYRYREPIVPGGDVSIIVRKSDGKILRIVAEE